MNSINKYIIILFIIIIIFNIIYYLYTTKKDNNIEKFNSYVNEIGNIDIVSRPCSVYFSKDANECDLLTEYYDKGITQLDILISKYNNSSNIDLDNSIVSKLQEIKNNKLNNIYNCKIQLDGWKEISSNITEKNSEYPLKNINDLGYYNIIDGKSLSGTCFNNLNDNKSKSITSDDIIKLKSDEKIMTINDVNYPGIKSYTGIDFKLNNINYNTLNKSICENNILQYTEIDIPENKILIRLKCYMDNNILKVSNFEFVKYNKVINKFNLLNYIESNNIIKTLFRYSYDIPNTNIIYGPKRIETQCYIIKYDNCKKVNKIDINSCSFSFIDFNIKNKIVSSYNNIVSKDIPPVDDDKLNYEDNINSSLMKIINTVNDKSSLDNQINTYNTNISQLNTSYINKKKQCDNIIIRLSSQKKNLENNLKNLNCDIMPDYIVDTDEKKRRINNIIPDYDNTINTTDTTDTTDNTNSNNPNNTNPTPQSLANIIKTEEDNKKYKSVLEEKKKKELEFSKTISQAKSIDRKNGYYNYINWNKNKGLYCDKNNSYYNCPEDIIKQNPYLEYKDVTEIFTNYEKFDNSDPMMENPNKKKCLLKYDEINNQLNNLNSINYDKCFNDLNNIASLKSISSIELDRLNYIKNDMNELFKKITYIKENMNISYDIIDLNKKIKNNEIINIDNYIGNISNDDYLYINIL